MGSKSAVKAFVEDESVAIIHVYASKVKVDGESYKEFENIRGREGELILKLSEGEHTIGAVHQATYPKKVKTNYMDSTFSVQKGKEYIFGLYSYSQEYFETEGFEIVLYQPLETFSKIEKWGIACYVKEE